MCMRSNYVPLHTHSVPPPPYAQFVCNNGALTSATRAGGPAPCTLYGDSSLANHSHFYTDMRTCTHVREHTCTYTRVHL